MLNIITLMEIKLTLWFMAFSKALLKYKCIRCSG